jgi:hypothetical protein
MDDANGALFVFGLSTFLGEKPFNYCHQLVRKHGLVFYGPAEEQLLS